jgi:hypothetical protein
MQRRRDKKVAVKLMRKLLKKQVFAPDVLVTGKLRSYSAVKTEMALSVGHERGLRKNNQGENSHQPVRRREHSASNRLDPRNASCLCTPPSETSTSSAILHPATRSASSEPKRSVGGCFHAAETH